MLKGRPALPQLFVVCLLPVLLGFVIPSRATAQVMQPMCVSGCLPDYAVTVTPDGTDAPDRNATTGGYYATFSIHNSGQLNDTYYLSCSVTGPVTCNSLSTSSISVNSGSTKTVQAWYSVGNPGTGTISLEASGEATDDGYYDVHVVTPPASPIVLLKPWNGAVRDLSACVNACFEKVVTHATPAYFTMDVPRSFGLTYASGSARPTPVVWVDVLRPTGATTLSIGLQRVSNGANLTLLNGSTEAWYAASGDTVRMAAAFDAVSDSMSISGVYDIRVTVTAHFPTGQFSSTTLTTTVPVVYTHGGAYGEGVWPTGLPRLVTNTDAGGSALIQSDGSIFYYGAGHPGGIVASLSGTTLTALDGSTVTFNSLGLPTAASDPYGNATHYYWTAAQLDSIKDPMGRKIALAYSAGKLATATDPGGRVTHYTVNGSNQLVTIQDPDSVSTQFGYDGLGLLTSLTGRNGAVWKTVYDELRRVKADSAPAVLLHDGTTKRPTVTYLAAERVVWQPQTAGTSAATAKAAVKSDTIRADITDPLGARSRFKIDRFGAPLLAINPLGATTTFTRDTSGRVTQTIEPNGHVTQVTYGYENIQQGVPYNPYVVQEQRDASKGKGIFYNYDVNHEVIAAFGSYGDNWIPRRDFTYDTHHRLSTIKIGGSIVASTVFGYDSLSRVVSVTDAEGHRRASVYDNTTGNLAISINPLQDSTRRHFDALGRTDSVYAPNGAVTGTQYGLLNQVLSTRNPLGYVTQTRYNPDLTVQRIIDAKNQVYKFSYNVLGWPTARFDLADTTKADSMWYDAAGQLKRTKTRRGNVLQALYDMAGRLTETMYRRPGATVDTAYAIFSYDTVGKRVRGWNWSQTDSLVYNGLGQLTGHWMRQGSETFQWTYQYDAQDRLTMRSLYQNGTLIPAGTLTRNYDSYGQLTSTSAAGVIIRFDRAQLDSLVSKWVVNPGTSGSWWRSSEHDSTHAIVEDSISVPALDARYGQTITHDDLGRLAAVDLHGSTTGSRRYRYDLAGQLLQACIFQGAPCIGEYATTLNQDAYGYDATGNRKDPGIGTTIGAGNRVTWFKGYSIGYDADGNIVSKSGNGESWTYTWDPFDKLTDVKLNGVLVYHFVYDAFGNRVNRCTAATCSAGEREINDGSQFVLARSSSGAIADAYGYYPGGDQPMSLKLPSGRTGVFITDPQLRGTVRAIADADKNATNPEFKTYAVSPWGEVAADTGSITRLRLAGQQYDQGSRLYYMRARYYDPTLGRFLSEDPIGISGGLNLYAYAGNDPVNATDPSGLCAVRGTYVTIAGDPSTDLCVDNSAYGDHGGQLTGIPLPVLPQSPNGVPGTTASNKDGGPGGDEMMGRGPKPSCRMEAELFVANVVVDALSIWTGALGAKLLVRGGGRLLLAGAMESGLAMNGGANALRVAGSRVVIGEAQGALGVATRQAVGDEVARGASDLIQASVQVGVGAASQGVTAQSPLAADDHGGFDWAGMIPGVGSWRAGKALWRCAHE